MTAIPDSITVERIVQLLNELPRYSDIAEWAKTFRDSLRCLLPGVDLVALNINSVCDILGRDRRRPVLAYTQTLRAAQNDVQQTSRQYSVGDSHSERLVTIMRQLGFVADHYHAPHTFDYFISPGRYLGSILLFARADRPDATDAVTLLRELEPFILFAFTDAIARLSYTKPSSKVFVDMIASLSEEAGLTIREQEALVLYMFGSTYKEISERLISLPAAKKRILQVHRKLGVKSHSELVARYFGCVITPSEESEGEAG